MSRNVASSADTTNRVLRYAVFFLVISILSVLVFALVAGIFSPPAPRTVTESALTQAENAVAQTPGNGIAWAALASARWNSGDKDGAWKAIEQGRSLVDDGTIIYLNNSELELLILDENNEEAVDKATQYVQDAEAWRSEETSTYSARGITVTEDMLETKQTVQLYVYKASAEGNLERWEDAVATLSNAIALEPKAADVLTLRGWARLKLGDRAEAAADFREALKFLPDDPSATSGLSQATADAAAQPTSGTAE